MTQKIIILDGNSLTFPDALSIAQGNRVAISSVCFDKLMKSRTVVEKKACKSTPIYGLNTGFGWLANKAIPLDKLQQLQKNIILSHAVGMGPLLSVEETRLAMALRLNVLLKGFTGVRPVLCETLCSHINAEIYPLIPEYGSLGASGDLAPLAHLALPLIGEGKVLFEGNTLEAKTALQKAGIPPLTLEVKEGLSLINGTQIMLSVGLLALAKSLKLLEQADKIAALSYEGASAHTEPLDPFLHVLRGHPGQITSAEAILKEIEGSYLFDQETKRMRIQDPYSLRCAPQVHGASRDAIQFAIEVVTRELNAATDNPLVDPDSDRILSGGNFHGQCLAIAFDTAAMAVAELGSISERRLEVHLNPHISGLPPFLTPNGGLNSGYMLTQYLGGSFVNENKILSHPACTDSIPGNVGIEDHVSMGMTSARKLRQIVSNTKSILGIEYIVAAQAVDLRDGVKLGKGTQKTYDLIRKKVDKLEHDRMLQDELYEGVSTLDLLTEAP